MVSLRLAAFLFVLALVGAGCPIAPRISQDQATAPGIVSQPMVAPEPVLEAEVSPQPEAPQPKVQNAPVPVPVARAIYEDFTREKYEAALAAHEPIFLNFYAKWCPYCREQDPRVIELFKTFPKFVHGFRVDYDTEREMKSSFKIYTQHTFIYLNRDGAEVKRTIGTQSDEMMSRDLHVIAD